MRFYTIEQNGFEIPAVSFDGGKTAYSLNEIGYDCSNLTQFIKGCSYDREILEDLKAKGLRGCCAQTINLADVKICAPIVYPEQDVVCLGINYTDHAEEAGRFSKENFGLEREYTIYFSKRVNRATAPGEPIPAYEGLVEGLDYEVELGVVIGRDAKCVLQKDALDYVFGYTIINDVSARNLQTRHKQWYVGKSLDGFTPIGPCIVTPDELGDIRNLKISCTVNGELRQDSNTGLMLQTVEGAIADLTQGMTLRAGSIIATGTPAGVGMGFEPPKFLKSGDKIVCSIEGIGDLDNYIE